MAGGYELVYRRLAELPEVAECWRWAKNAISNKDTGFRLLRYEFKLITPGRAPPEVFVEWTVAANCANGIRRTIIHGQDGWYRINGLIQKWFFDVDTLTQIVKKNANLVKKTYPCKPSIAEDGHTRNRHPSFANWLIDRFRSKFDQEIETLDRNLKEEAKARMDSPAFREEAARVLEDLAVEDLAQKMVHYSRIPNVINRASKLFVVKDVMEG